MDWLYKFSMFVAVNVVIVTFFDIAKMIIIHVPISTFSVACLIFGWVVMVMMNPFWKDVWKKK